MDKQIILGDYALAYCKLGFHVIPIEWRKIAGREKRPLVEWLPYEDRLATEEEVISWWKRWPQANIGVVTGSKSGLLVIDIESAAGYEAFREKYGEPPQDTLAQRTGKDGGIHIGLRHPRDGLRYKNQTKVIKDVDTRGDGGYIVVAPSVHPSGKRYEWIVSPIEGNVAGRKGLDCIAPCPDNVKSIFSPYKDDGSSKQRKSKSKNTKKENDTNERKNPDGWVQDLLGGTDAGQRNDAMAKLVGWYLRAFKGDVEQVREVMRMVNERNRPPLDWKELDKIIDSIASRQATCEMGDELGEDIDKIEVLEYPDGSRKYNVYLQNVQGYAQLSLKELGQFTIFKWRFGDLAGYIPSPIKQNSWEDKVNKALNEAKHIPISTEETNMGIVMSAIDRAIASRDVSSDLKHLNTRIVLVGENGDQRIFLQISTLMGALKFEGEKLTRTQVGEILRKLGFENKLPARTTVTSSARIWTSTLLGWEQRKGIM